MGLKSKAKSEDSRFTMSTSTMKEPTLVTAKKIKLQANLPSLNEPFDSLKNFNPLKSTKTKKPSSKSNSTSRMSMSLGTTKAYQFQSLTFTNKSASVKNTDSLSLMSTWKTWEKFEFKPNNPDLLLKCKSALDQQSSYPKLSILVLRLTLKLLLLSVKLPTKSKNNNSLGLSTEKSSTCPPKKNVKNKKRNSTLSLKVKNKFFKYSESALMIT